MSAPVVRDTPNSRIDDLHRRVRILEAVPPGGVGACSAYAPWSDYGGTTLGIYVSSTGGCASVSSPPSAGFHGNVWACDTDDASLATSMITGNLEITITDNGAIDATGCGPGDLLAYAYGFLPPFWQGGEDMPAPRTAPFGFGISYDAATDTVYPAWLTYEPTADLWVVKVAGTDTSGIGSYANQNTCRPNVSTSGDPIPPYPFDFEAGAGDSLLFSGTFLYFVALGD